MAKESYTKWPDQDCADSSPVLVPPSEGQVELPGNRRSMASEPTRVEVDVSAGDQGKGVSYTEDLPPLHTNKVFSILDLTGLMIVHDLLFRYIGYGIEEHKCNEIIGQDACWKMTLGPYQMVDIPLMTCRTMQEWSRWISYVQFCQRKGCKAALRYPVSRKKQKKYRVIRKPNDWPDKEVLDMLGANLVDLTEGVARENPTPNDGQVDAPTSFGFDVDNEMRRRGDVSPLQAKRSGAVHTPTLQ